MILNLVVIQIDNVKNKFCKCFRKLKSLLLKVGVDIRKNEKTHTRDREKSMQNTNQIKDLSKIYKEFIKLEQRK